MLATKLIPRFSPECLHLRRKCNTGATLPDIVQTIYGMTSNMYRIMSSERCRCLTDSKHSLCHLPSSALHTLSEPCSRSILSSSTCKALCVYCTVLVSGQNLFIRFAPSWKWVESCNSLVSSCCHKSLSQFMELPSKDCSLTLSTLKTSESTSLD